MKFNSLKGRKTRHDKILGNVMEIKPTLLKLSAFDLKELDLLTSGFACISTQEEGRSATTRNQTTFV